MDKTFGLCRSTEDCGKGISMLALRLFAAYEFGEAGLAKWRGENWFADIRDAFPFPFDLLPAGLSWNLAMGAELVVPVLLVLGLLTRLGALALMILTAVAWYAVHAGNGYNGLYLPAATVAPAVAGRGKVFAGLPAFPQKIAFRPSERRKFCFQTAFYSLPDCFRHIHSFFNTQE